MGTVKCGRPTNLQKHNSPNCEWPTSANPASIAGQGSQRFQGERTRERGARASDIGCFGMLGVLECFRRVQRWKDNQRHLNSIPLWVLLISESFCTEWIQAVCSMKSDQSPSCRPIVRFRSSLFVSHVFIVFSGLEARDISRPNTLRREHRERRSREREKVVRSLSCIDVYLVSAIILVECTRLFKYWVSMRDRAMAYYRRASIKTCVAWFSTSPVMRCPNRKAIGFLKGNTLLWFSWECKNHHDISRPYTSSCRKTQSLQTWWEYEITRKISKVLWHEEEWTGFGRGTKMGNIVQICNI